MIQLQDAEGGRNVSPGEGSARPLEAITVSEKSVATAGGIVEILTLTLKPGTREEFQRIYVNEALALLRKWNFRVVAHGPSQHDENSYFVIRTFKSLADRQAAEDAYYSSEDWRHGPRTAILAMLEHDSYVVVPIATLKQCWDPGTE
jgi:hypothetical protein